MSTGNTVQIIGAVVDVEFPSDQIPHIYDALIIDDVDITLEVLVDTLQVGDSRGRALPVMTWEAKMPEVFDLWPLTTEYDPRYL